MSAYIQWIQCEWSVRADLRQEEEEDFVIGKDGMRCDAQQEVLQANSPSLYEVRVEVVRRQLVPHELCLQDSQSIFRQCVIKDTSSFFANNLFSSINVFFWISKYMPLTRFSGSGGTMM